MKNKTNVLVITTAATDLRHSRHNILSLKQYYGSYYIQVYYYICIVFRRNFETMVFRNVLCVTLALSVAVNAFLPTAYPRFNAGASCRQMSMAERNDLRNVAIIGEIS